MFKDVVSNETLTNLVTEDNSIETQEDIAITLEKEERHKRILALIMDTPLSYIENVFKR